MTTPTKIEAILIRLEFGDVEFDTPFRYQGVDSLDFQEIIIECENEFGILLEAADLAQVEDNQSTDCPHR